MIKLLLGMTGVSLPVGLVYLNVSYPDVRGRIFFSVVALVIASVKIWESFFTSKEKKALKYHGDWTLILTSFLYLLAGLFIMSEFFILNRGLNVYLIVLGAIIVICAATLRRLSIVALGNQWAIHALGESKLFSKHILTIKGPYKYIRHPIYLSYIMDLVGLSVLFGAFYSLVFIIMVNIPSYLSRARNEEKSSIRRFGPEYAVYAAKTPLMLPRIF